MQIPAADEARTVLVGYVGDHVGGEDGIAALKPVAGLVTYPLSYPLARPSSRFAAWLRYGAGHGDGGVWKASSDWGLSRKD